MEVSTGYFIVGLIILLFIIGTGSLIIDSLLNNQDISTQTLEPEKIFNYKYNNYYHVELEDD